MWLRTVLHQYLTPWSVFHISFMSVILDFLFPRFSFDSDRASFRLEFVATIIGSRCRATKSMFQAPSTRKSPRACLSKSESDPSTRNGYLAKQHFLLTNKFGLEHEAFPHASLTLFILSFDFPPSRGLKRPISTCIVLQIMGTTSAEAELHFLCDNPKGRSQPL